MVGHLAVMLWSSFQDCALVTSDDDSVPVVFQ